MSESETKAIREKLNLFQEWMEGEIDNGHMSLEQTPECFDRERYNKKKKEQQKQRPTNDAR